MAIPAHCSTCDRAMRSCHAKAADHPDTVAHAAGGLCTTCYGRANRKPRAPKARHVSLTSVPDFTPEQTARVHSLAAVFGRDVNEQIEFTRMLLGDAA